MEYEFAGFPDDGLIWAGRGGVLLVVFVLSSASDLTADGDGPVIGKRDLAPARFGGVPAATVLSVSPRSVSGVRRRCHLSASQVDGILKAALNPDCKRGPRAPSQIPTAPPRAVIANVQTMASVVIASQ